MASPGPHSTERDGPAAPSDGGGSAAAEASPLGLQNPLSNAPTSVVWIQELELGYIGPASRPPVCFSCGGVGLEAAAAAEGALSKCARCRVAAYCSRDCQLRDWREGRHKLACPSYARVAGPDPPNAETRAEIRNELLSRIRFYVCPYAVFRSTDLGRGFLFLQTDRTLSEMSIYIPKDCTGRAVTRSVLLHYLTVGEFDSEVCREDFELVMVRSKLKEAVESYDTEKEAVLLCRFRCGHMALGRAVLVPDYRICQKLGQDYYAGNPSGALQLNLDDL